MNDRLSEVLKAVEGKKSISSSGASVDLSLISYSNLSSNSQEAISQFQDWVKQKYDISICAVGGGYGCTRIDFEIKGDLSSTAEFVRQILQGGEIHEKAVEVGFKVLITNNPCRARVDLVNGSIEGGIAVDDFLKNGEIKMVDNSVKIYGPVTNSGVVSNSENTKQVVRTNNYSCESQQALSEAASEIQRLLKQLEETNQTASELEQVAYVNIAAKPALKQRAIAALKEGGETAIEEFFLDNKYLKVGKAVIKGWLQPSGVA
jgi:hypothetical protein